MQRWFLPSPNDVVFVIAFFAAVVLGSVLTSRDGDLGRHLRVGEWMLDNRALPLVDVFSYTAAGMAVVVHEWLAQLVMAVAYRIAGFNGIGLLTAVLVAAPWAMTSRALLKRGIPVSLAATFSVFGAVASVVHWAARPHVFTVVFVAYWLIALEDYELGRRRHLWFLPPLMLFWANLHGAFIIGFVLISMYLLAALIDRKLSRAKHLSLVLAASILASLANPNGIGLIANSFGYIGDDFLLRFTSEYNSPDFHLKGFWPLLVLILLGVVLSVPKRVSARLLFVGWTAFALYSFRNAPLFALVAVPLLAEQAHAWLREHPDFLFSLRSRLAVRGEPWSEINRRVVGGALSAVIVLVVGLAWGHAEQDSRFFFDQDLFPVETMAELGENPPGDRVLNQFAWGGYLLYCCWPEIEVFIDGQTDFYGPDLTREYEKAITGDPEWRDTLEKHAIDWVLVEPKTPLAQILTESSEWQELSQDGTASVFVRAPKT